MSELENLYMKLNATNTANAGIQLLNKELTEKNTKLDKEAQDLYNKNLELQGELAIYKKALREIEQYQNRNCETCVFANTNKCDYKCQVFVIMNIIKTTKKR